MNLAERREKILKELDECDVDKTPSTFTNLKDNTERVKAMEQILTDEWGEGFNNAIRDAKEIIKRNLR